MRKELLLLALFISVSQLSISQNNVGIGTTNPEPSALLDLEAADKGLLIPRVELIGQFNGVNPVNNPATGLLVYNETGSMAEGFYYWDGTQWVMVGAGGGTEECVTLDEAYNCQGSGMGRIITADAGEVEIIVPSSAANDVGLWIETNKGTNFAPGIGLISEHSQRGIGIFSELTDVQNPYGAIQGIVNSNLTGNELPTGVSGYHLGNGLGVGVWGEAETNSTAGPSYGVYGIGSGTGNVFGGYFWSNSYPGLFVETNADTVPAAQLAAAGQNALNPGIVAVGSVQITCGFTGFPNEGEHIFFNNIGNEATIGPDLGMYGFLGVPGVEWWYLYYYNAIQASRRELKRDINYFNDDIADFIMADIEKLKPAFYKYKSENDEIVPNMEQRTRYNMHLGFMLDETPDYIQDNSFSGIDIYSLASLGIAGVQHNRNSIVELQEIVKKQQKQINDFGIANFNGTEVYIEFNQDFQNQTPVINITPNSPVAGYYIKEQNSKGFILAVENPKDFQFNWIAMANVEVETHKQREINIDPVLKSQLRVEETKKQHLHNLLFREQNTPLKLKGTTEKRPVNRRFENIRISE